MGNFLTAALRAAFRNRHGVQQGLEGVDSALDNSFALRWARVANNSVGKYWTEWKGLVTTFRVDANDKVMYGGLREIDPPAIPVSFRFEENGDLPAAATAVPFWIANYSGEITAARINYQTAGSDGSAVTMDIRKVPTGYAATAAAGTSILSSQFNMKATAKTVQTATLVDNQKTLKFVAGDVLIAVFTGTLTSLAGVVGTVDIMPNVAVVDVTFNQSAATPVDQAFFIANFPMSIYAMRYVHRVAGAASSNVQVTKDTSTNAPGAGTDLLTNDSNAGFECDGTAGTVQTGTFSATTLAAGDRLSVDFAGTVTALAGVCVTVSLNAPAGQVYVTYNKRDTNGVDQEFFVAGRTWKLLDGRYVHSAAQGGAANAQIERVSSTTAAGSGTVLLTNNTNAGFDANATANTVEVAALVTPFQDQYIHSGDRLCIDLPTEGSLLGVVTTITLTPA